MYGKPARTELRRKIKRKTVVCTLHCLQTFFPLEFVQQDHALHSLCLERPTSYFILNAIVSNLNYNTGSRFSSVLPKDKTV
jgi:hypothetical protein